MNDVAEASKKVLDNIGRECSLDMHGYCQAHFLEQDCSVKNLIMALEGKPKTQGEKSELDLLVAVMKAARTYSASHAGATIKPPNRGAALAYLKANKALLKALQEYDSRKKNCPAKCVPEAAKCSYCKMEA